MARLTSEEQDTAVIGFLDESTKAVHANTARMWSVGKPYRITNYTVDGVKVSGFYALNGNSVLTRLADIKSTSICDMLIAVRDANGDRPIVMILDNASNHHSKIVVGKAEELGIELVFLPPYSPKYNPIEQIWKTVKREISKAHLILDLDELYWLIRDVFLGECLSGNYADAWKSDFLSENLRNRISLSMVS